MYIFRCLTEWKQFSLEMMGTWLLCAFGYCLTALFPWLPEWASTRKVKPSGFYWSKRQWVAVASARYMQVCTSLQTDDHANTPRLKFFTARCPSCCPTNSIKALKTGIHTPQSCLHLLKRLLKNKTFSKSVYAKNWPPAYQWVSLLY